LPEPLQKVGFPVVVEGSVSPIAGTLSIVDRQRSLFVEGTCSKMPLVVLMKEIMLLPVKDVIRLLRRFAYGGSGDERLLRVSAIVEQSGAQRGDLTLHNS
jgi:hypothetical protein